MSDSPAEEAPVYHRKSLTPESPRPLHAPSPANIPILDHQIEPIFNLISSHTLPPYAARDLTHMDHELVNTPAMTSEVPAQSLDASDVKSNEQAAAPSDIPSSLQPTSLLAANEGDADGGGASEPSAEDAAAAAAANTLSHAANTSVPTPSQSQSHAATQADPASQHVPSSTTAQTSAESEQQTMPLATNVADQGMAALLQSLSTPRIVQSNANGDALGLPEQSSYAPNGAQQANAGEENNPAPNNRPPSSHQAMPQSDPANRTGSVYQPYSTGTDPSRSPFKQDLSALAAVPPPGLGSAAPPATHGLPQLPMPSVTAGAPGVPASLPHPVRAASQQTGRPSDPERESQYQEFLSEETRFVAEGTWDKFPAGSRLFVGNLPSEVVGKRDVWDIFEKYGKLAQISIKQAYGFVQFMDVEACQRAMKQEQGGRIKDRNMHLELSKPAKNSRIAAGAGADNERFDDRRRNRSRSPDRSGRNQRGGRNRNGSYNDFRDDPPRRDEPRRGRDDYRPGRSPSPRRRGDDYRPGRDRSPDRYYDGQRRSRSPYSRYGRRSPSPRRPGLDDELPLPKRAPRDVPDVQIILVETVSDSFVDFVVDGFRKENLRVDVLNMPRAPLDAVEKRQIVEGVSSLCKLTRREEATGKIPLRVFVRVPNSDSVRYEDYEDLEMHIVAKLAATKARAAPPPPTPAYVPPYMQQQQVQAAQVPAIANNPQLQHLITTLDGPALQQLLSAMGQQQSTPTQSGFPQPDMSALMANVPPQQRQAMPQAYPYPQQPQQPQQQQHHQQAPAYGYPPTGYPPQQSQNAYPQHQAYGQSSNQDPNQVQSIMQQLAGIQRKP